MWLLVVAGTLIPLAYIGYLLSRFDRFVKKGGFVSDTPTTELTAAVMGDGEMSRELAEMLKKDKINILKLKGPDLSEQMRSCSCLFAISESDIDNLVLCRVGRKLFNIDRIIGLCNDTKNENLFQSENIPYFTKGTVSAQKLYQVMTRQTETK
jgi:hypothetical protein